MVNLQTLLGRFNTGDTVTVDIYELTTNTLILEGETCSEIASTGIFKYKPDITVTEYTEFLWIMSNQNNSLVDGNFDLDIVFDEIQSELSDISSSVDLISGYGSDGKVEKTYTLTKINGEPIADALIKVTSDELGRFTIAQGRTNQNGEITLQLDEGSTVYIWRSKVGLIFENPDIEVV